MIGKLNDTFNILNVIKDNYRKFMGCVTNMDFNVLEIRLCFNQISWRQLIVSDRLNELT